MKPSTFCILLLTWSLTPLCARAVPWASRHDMTAAQYQAEFNTWTTDPFNYRLIAVDGYEKNGQPRYAAIWEERAGPDYATHNGLTQAQYDALNTQYVMGGLRCVFLSAFGVGNQAYYNAIWEAAPGADVLSEVGMSYGLYVALNADRIVQGYKLIHLATCGAGGAEYFAAIWRKRESASYQVRVRRTSAEYQQEFETWGAQGYRLIAVSAAVVGGQPLYTGVWKKPANGGDWYAFHGLSESKYQAESLNAYYEGYRPVFVSAFNFAGGERFNVVLERNGGMSGANLAAIDKAVATYMNDNAIPGMSVAISRQGRLVYAKGFGLADQDAGEWVHPLHRFRVASVSKPFTATAVMKLVECCGLDLDDPVFGTGRILGTDFGSTPYSAQEKQITLRQLLQHVSGWSTDGIWQVNTDNPDDAIDWQLDNASGEPANPPGSVYDYMNIGFCVAGRVIEKRSGRPYEQFVQQEVLAPACVTDMEIGGRTLAERKPLEVVYYQSSGGSPYNLSPRRMDAHGGWIAKPMDLLLFLRRIDSNTNQAELLRETSLTEMRTGSAANASYGLGLGFNADGFGHNGAMNGTLSDLAYLNDGTAFAVTCNTWPGTDQYATGLKSTLMGIVDALNAANAWPNLDLFPCEVPPGDPPSTQEVTRDIYVDGSSRCGIQNGSKTCGLLGGPFLTVNQALGIVCAGDRLHIRGGSYHETALFNRKLTVRAYDGAAIIGQ